MDKRIKQSLNNAIGNFPHPSLQEIVENKPEKMNEHDFITRQDAVEEKKTQRRFMPYPVIMLCFVFIIMGSFLYNSSNQAVAVVNLDINPSFEMRVNRHNEVKKITGLNEEARRIIKRCDYKGKELQAVIRMLFEQMKKDEYISRQKNTVLLSVRDRSGKRTNELKNELYSDITAVMEQEQIKPNIIRQNLQSRDKLSGDAKELGISEGKLQFIRVIMQFDKKLSAGELAELSMDELAGLVRNNGWDITGNVDVDDDFETGEDEDDDDNDNRGEPEREGNAPEKTQNPEKSVKKSPAPTKRVKKQTPVKQQPPVQKKNDDDKDDEDDDDRKQYQQPKEKKKIQNNNNRKEKDRDDDDDDEKDDEEDDSDEED